VSALTDRITEVQAAHQRAPDHHGTFGNCAACNCGWLGAGYATHVAERIEAELPQLSEVQKLLGVWTEGSVTDQEAYWRLRQILRPSETSADRINDAKRKRL
jgi:hypothetical protein